MNTGDLLSESDWQYMVNPPDTDQNAWDYGTHLIDEFFAPDAHFWVETNNKGELIASDLQSQSNGQAGSGIDTGGGPGSVEQQQIDNGIDFLPQRASSEVLDAVVSTNQQSSSPASPDPAVTPPSVVVSNTELPAAERAEISKTSSSLPPSVFGGERDSDVAMEDSSPPPFVRATTPLALVIGREGAQTFPYGTDGTAGRTPPSAQQPLPHATMASSNAFGQTLRATPSMAATTALYSSSPYERGRHTQSTDGAKRLRGDMEQKLNVLPDTIAAIPFFGLKIEDTKSPAQEAAKEEEPASTVAKVTKKRASTRKPKSTTETTKSSVPATAEDDESPITLAKVPKKRAYTGNAKWTIEATTSSVPEASEVSESNITLAKVTKKRANTRKSGPTTEATESPAQETAKVDEHASTPAKVVKTRKPKAAIETQMFAVQTTSDNGTQVEKLAKGSELGFTSPAPKATRAPKRKAEADGGLQRKKPAFARACSAREVSALKGVQKEVSKKRKTRSSGKVDSETEDGPNAGKAVQQRRQAKEKK
ncbi:hypothetical protein Q7P36_001677 [Cladosporium allicinum]